MLCNYSNENNYNLLNLMWIMGNINKVKLLFGNIQLNFADATNYIPF